MVSALSLVSAIINSIGDFLIVVTHDSPQSPVPNVQGRMLCGVSGCHVTSGLRCPGVHLQEGPC